MVFFSDSVVWREGKKKLSLRPLQIQHSPVETPRFTPIFCIIETFPLTALKTTMKRPLTLTLITLALCTGCSSQSFLPTDTSLLTIDSQPRGASVYIMGEAVGYTPVQVMRKQIFPVTYPPSLQTEYGTLTLESPGCESYRVPVSNRILEDGLMAKLSCEDAERSPASKAAQAAAAAPAGDGIKHRLIKLKELFEEGLITEAEYNAKRGAIIDEL